MIFLDIETTGLDPRKNSIVSIGAVDYIGPHRFYEECRIWKGAEISQEALNINGFNPEQITNTNKLSQKEILENLIDWTHKIIDITLAGENIAGFDLQFLKESFTRECLKSPFGHRTDDLHSIARNHYMRRGISPPLVKNKSSINLDSTLIYVGLPPEPKPHNALRGAILEAEAYHRLTYGRGYLAEFREFEIPKYLEHR